jgi:hypothetical protein
MFQNNENCDAIECHECACFTGYADGTLCSEGSPHLGLLVTGKLAALPSSGGVHVWGDRAFLLMAKKT